MLSGPALPSGSDLADLVLRTRGLALRFDQVRRDCIDLDLPADCPNTARRAREIEADAATIAEVEAVMTALLRADRAGTPPSAARRLSLSDRTLAALGRLTPFPDRPVRIRGDHACPPNPSGASRTLSASSIEAASPRSATST